MSLLVLFWSVWIIHEFCFSFARRRGVSAMIEKLLLNSPCVFCGLWGMLDFVSFVGRGNSRYFRGMDKDSSEIWSL